MLGFIGEVPFEVSTMDTFSPTYKKTIVQKTLVIPGGGCRIWRKSKGRICIMCGFPHFSRQIVLGSDHMSSFDSWMLDEDIYWQMYLAAFDDGKDANTLAIFNGGSFFEKTELPLPFQYNVLEHFSTIPDYQQLFVEARPEYLDVTLLKDAKKRIGTKDLMIGIGLESANNTVRNKLLKKAMILDVFEASILQMKDEGIQCFVYVMLGAPGLSERDALKDTIETIEYLVGLGVDHIALSTTFVPPNTPLQTWYEQGEFSPPWLWSVLQLAQRAQTENWPLTIGGFSDNPKPVAGPENCGQCDGEVLNSIDIYRKLGHLPDIPALTCSCQSDWQKDQEKASTWKLPSLPS